MNKTRTFKLSICPVRIGGNEAKHTLEMDGRVIGHRTSLNHRYTAAVVKIHKGVTTVENWCRDKDLAEKQAKTNRNRFEKFRHRLIDKSTPTPEFIVASEL